VLDFPKRPPGLVTNRITCEKTIKDRQLVHACML
jgi:hypothetical protein